MLLFNEKVKGVLDICRFCGDIEMRSEEKKKIYHVGLTDMMNMLKKIKGVTLARGHLAS